MSRNLTFLLRLDAASESMLGHVRDVQGRLRRAHEAQMPRARSAATRGPRVSPPREV